jgi:hypothetical protein
VGGLFYHDSKTRDQRKEFVQDFNKNNIEREKAGLSKLDWCDELYKFDQSWYGEDQRCAKRAADAKPVEAKVEDKTP